MTRILHIETATTVCSVALSEAGRLLELAEITDQGFAHGEQLTVLIEKLMLKSKLQFSDLNAISVSSGPGSYTGLRIGVSTAKGLCYALKIPLISVNTLLSYTEIARQFYPNASLCAMIDARRMEVFSSLVTSENQLVKPPSADVLGEFSYTEFDPFVCFGDGSSKVKDLWANRSVTFADVTLSASGQVKLAYEKFLSNDFEDVAYFEPNYIKAFYQPTKEK